PAHAIVVGDEVREPERQVALRLLAGAGEQRGGVEGPLGEPGPEAGARLGLGDDGADALGGEHALEGLAPAGPAAPPDVVGPPRPLKEAAEGVERVAGHLVGEAAAAEALLRVARADAHGLDDVLLGEPRQQLEREQVLVDGLEPLVRAADPVTLAEAPDD